MKHFFIGFLILFQILSCKSKDSSPLQDDNFEAIHQQFHGKYKIVSSVSSEPLDINLDGTSSPDLLTEIEELTTGAVTSPYLTILIYGSSKVDPEPSYLFVQAWPEQFVRMGPGKAWDGIEMIPFNASYSFAYDMKVVVREFEFSKDRKNLHVETGDSEEALFSQSAPKTVTVLDDGKLVVVANRRIYTSSGVKQVTVTTTYERSTKLT